MLETPTPAGALSSIPQLTVAGQRLAAIDYDGVSSLVSDHVLSGDSPLTIDAANTMSIASACGDRELAAALSTYDLVLPDATPLLWCMNAKGADLADRAYGPYAVEHILEALPDGTSVALVGGAPAMHELLTAAQAERFSQIELVSLDDGDYTDLSPARIRESFELARERGARVIFVCLGVPRQYLWTAEAQKYATDEVIISVGGAFDFVVGMQVYAPAWMQERGLTWLHRALSEPRRLIPRYLKFNSLFVWYLLTREILPGHLSVPRMVRAERRRRRKHSKVGKRAE